jgi:hypothetical protein
MTRKLGKERNIIVFCLTRSRDIETFNPNQTLLENISSRFLPDVLRSECNYKWMHKGKKQTAKHLHQVSPVSKLPSKRNTRKHCVNTEDIEELEQE